MLQLQLTGILNVNSALGGAGVSVRHVCPVSTQTHEVGIKGAGRGGAHPL